MKGLLKVLSAVVIVVMLSATEGYRREITCFTFDNSFNGMFNEWVNVSNVQRVTNGCKYGACAFFNGLKSAIEIPRFESTFSAFRSFSLSFWYRRTLENPHVLVGNGQCGDTASLRVMGYFLGDIKATLRTTSGSHSGKVRVSTKEWHHLVVTWCHNKMRMYVDKQLVTQGSLSGPLYNSRCSLSIGAKPANSSPIIGYYRGYIDQMCLYRTPLTPSDIEKLYNNPSIVKLP